MIYLSPTLELEPLIFKCSLPRETPRLRTAAANNNGVLKFEDLWFEYFGCSWDEVLSASKPTLLVIDDAQLLYEE